MQRPLGVTILALLSIVGGVLAILGGVLATGVAELDSAGLDANVVSQALRLGPVGIGLGIVQLVVGLGLWGLQGWAWLVGVIVTAVRLVGDAFSLIGSTANLAAVLISLAISVIILWYLFQPDVRKAFGRG